MSTKEELLARISNEELLTGMQNFAEFQVFKDDVYCHRDPAFTRAIAAKLENAFSFFMGDITTGHRKFNDLFNIVASSSPADFKTYVYTNGLSKEFEDLNISLFHPLTEIAKYIQDEKG